MSDFRINKETQRATKECFDILINYYQIGKKTTINAISGKLMANFAVGPTTAKKIVINTLATFDKKFRLEKDEIIPDTYEELDGW